MFGDPLIASLVGTILILLLVFILQKIAKKDNTTKEMTMKDYIKLFVVSIISFIFVLMNYSPGKVAQVLGETVDSGLAPF